MGFVLIAAFLYSIPCVYAKWDALMLSNPSLLKTFGFLVGHREVSVPHPHLPAVQGVSLYREPLADAAAPQFKAWLGLWRVITATPNSSRGVLLVVAVLSATVPSSFRGKTLSHQIKSEEEAGGQLAGLKRGREFCSSVAPAWEDDELLPSSLAPPG